MNHRRPVTALLLSLGAITVLTLVPTAMPDLVTRRDLLGWWAHHGTAAAAIGLLHLVVVAAAAYVVVVLGAVVAANAAGRPAAALRAARLSPPAMRRWLTVGILTATMASTGPVGAQDGFRLDDVGPTAPVGQPFVLTDLGPASTAVDPTSAPPSTSTITPVSPETHRSGFRAAASSEHPDAWRVEAGDNLWAIAEQVVDAATTDPTDADVWRYWRDLIAANETTVDDPDMIHPGQVLNLPAMPTGGS